MSQEAGRQIQGVNTGLFRSPLRFVRAREWGHGRSFTAAKHTETDSGTQEPTPGPCVPVWLIFIHLVVDFQPRDG